MGIIDTSNIDATKPDDSDLQTQDLRDNFAAINVAFDAANTRTATNKAAAVLLTPVANAMLFVGGTDGGWFKGVTGSSGYSDNGGSYCGTQFIPTGGDGSSAWVRVYDGAISVAWFGAVGDNSTDDQSSIQAAIDYSNSVIQGSGYASIGDKSNIPVYFPKGVYVLDLTVGIYPYTTLIGDEAIIKCSSTHYAFSNAIANGFYRFRAKGLSIHESNGFDIDNNNQDAGLLSWEDCKFVACPTAVSYDCQSSIGIFSNCVWFKCDTEIDVITGDYVVINDSWIKQADRTANNQAGIENAGKLIINNTIGVPGATGGFSETAWINNRATAGGHRTGVVILDKFRAGGESGSKTLVNNYAPANDDTDIRPTVVSITNSDVYTVDGVLATGRGVVRLFDTPNLLTMKDNTGFNQTVALVAASGVNLTTLMAGKEDIIKVEMDNFKSTGFSFAGDPTNNILPELYAAEGVSKQIEQTAFSKTLDSSLSGWTIIGRYPSGSSDCQLPPAVTGLRYKIIRSDESGLTNYRIKPDGTEIIHGGTAGQYVNIAADWVGLVLHCVEDGRWEIESVINNAYGAGYTYV